jgi:general L-amino acid transport system permease protein
MAIAAEVPKDNFRLSQLIYDTRYRSYTIQVVVLILVFLFVAWLVDNTITNLAAKDKDISFSFLWQRAGYDIDQRLIPYTNDSSHGRAAIVGLLNTLVVAFFGCILATIIGVFAGVLRLSRNWLVSRIMTVYVETFRNVPLLLWIILSYTVFSETMPQPNEFKVTQAMVDSWQTPDTADDIYPTATKAFFGTIALTNRGTNVPAPLVERPLGSVNILGVPFNLSFWATLAIIVASIWGYRRLQRSATVVQEATGIRPVTWWKSLLILLLPTVVFLAALGFHIEIPAFPADENGVSKGFNFQGGISIAHSFSALLIAISLYTGAFIAEAVRGGIQAISRGQSEAAYALGLRPGRTMKLVILPQALRVIIPPLISQYLNLTKNTTLGFAISYLDLKGTLGGITLNQTGRELECMLLMMLTYLILSLIISALMNIYNTAVKLKER